MESPSGTGSEMLPCMLSKPALGGLHARSATGEDAEAQKGPCFAQGPTVSIQQGQELNLGRQSLAHALLPVQLPSLANKHGNVAQGTVRSCYVFQVSSVCKAAEWDGCAGC